MKAKHLIPFAAAMLILSGCLVLSVYPFYSQKDVSFDPRIAGSWTNAAEADNQWVFENIGTNGYGLVYSEKSVTNNIAVTLFKLQNTTFMDFLSRDKVDSVMPPPIPSHMLFRVTLSTDRIKMAPLNYEWLEKLVEKNSKAIRHHVVPDPENPDKGTGLIVLTADTQELQKFIIKNLQTADAWKDPFELVKIASKSAVNK